MFEYQQKQQNKSFHIHKPISPNLTGIPSKMKSQFEHYSGFSFDDVRVHYNSDKPVKFHSLAFTQGNDIYMRVGQERHLPHELGHVVQQKAGMVQSTVKLDEMPLNDNPHMEMEADCIASLAIADNDINIDKNIEPMNQYEKDFIHKLQNGRNDLNVVQRMIDKVGIEIEAIGLHINGKKDVENEQLETTLSATDNFLEYNILATKREELKEKVDFFHDVLAEVKKNGFFVYKNSCGATYIMTEAKEEEISIYFNQIKDVRYKYEDKKDVEQILKDIEEINKDSVNKSSYIYSIQLNLLGIKTYKIMDTNKHDKIHNNLEIDTENIEYVSNPYKREEIEKLYSELNDNITIINKYQTQVDKEKYLFCGSEFVITKSSASSYLARPQITLQIAKGQLNSYLKNLFNNDNEMGYFMQYNKEGTPILGKNSILNEECYHFIQDIYEYIDNVKYSERVKGFAKICYCTAIAACFEKNAEYYKARFCILPRTSLKMPDTFNKDEKDEFEKLMEDISNSTTIKYYLKYNNIENFDKTKEMTLEECIRNFSDNEFYVKTVEGKIKGVEKLASDEFASKKDEGDSVGYYDLPAESDGIYEMRGLPYIYTNDITNIIQFFNKLLEKYEKGIEYEAKANLNYLFGIAAGKPNPISTVLGNKKKGKK